ncbi:hypothetical protein J45TS6_30350 [Paenibacillus sp. J45TS6]|uniref:hypothetical protein n=1 Tax=Paenibacillus sp. J45TS6 TaxID=2807196 RepID=UPI001B09E7E3|nr:hypothetical protein [Paenibacillus sp. J45TS6]GIP44576.1 hypothetical protein J45TS6_30350 [Paenibacillus sp. J45TS6]
MIVFAYIAVYIMPILGFLFIVALLRAIKKIVKNKSYTAEVFWSGLLFGLIVWCIAIVAIFNEW